MTTPSWMPPLPTPRKKPVYATSKNTASVRSGYEMGGYEKEPPLWDENQMHDYALAAVEAYKASLKPVAKLVKVRNRFGYIEQFTCERLSIPNGSEVLSEVPLYRLDGGNDE